MTDRHVVLVEDEPHIAEAVRFILSRRGWQVEVERDGARALATIAQAGPDAVILDMMLPGRSGLEILADLRADPAHARLPVLMLTARGQARDREAAAHAGATEFLAKPFANAELLEVLEQIVTGDVAMGAAPAPDAGR